MKPTGTSSTSFRIWLATFIPSVAATVTAFTQNSGGSKSAVLGGAGILSALFSTLGKLFHDHGVSIASIQQAGTDVAAQLPQLKLDASKTAAFIENDVPALKGTIDALTARVAAAEAHVASVVAPDSAAVESVVRKVLGQLAPPALAPEAPPAA